MKSVIANVVGMSEDFSDSDFYLIFLRSGNRQFCHFLLKCYYCFLKIRLWVCQFWKGFLMRGSGFLRALFLISAYSVRKKFCKVSNLSPNTDKLSFGVSLWPFSISKWAVVWDSFPFDLALVKQSDKSFGTWSFVNVFAEVQIKSQLLSFLYNVPVETNILISSSRSRLDKYC